LRAHCVGERLAAIGAAPIHVDATTPSLVKFVATGFNSLEPATQHAMKFNEAYTGNFRSPQSMTASGLRRGFKAYGYEDYELACTVAGAFGLRQMRGPSALHQGFRRDGARQHRGKVGRVLFVSKHPQLRRSG
jgi:hypothetical protein